MNIDLKVVVFLLSLASTGFAVVLGLSVGSEEFLVPTLFLAAFAILVIIGKPEVAVIGVIATFASGVTLPGLPGQMKLSDGFSLALIGVFVIQSAMKSGPRVPFSQLDWVLILFCGWIATIGAVRGFGFLAFGGDKIGGFYYLRLFLAASLVITLPRIAMPRGAWKITLLAMGILAPATLIADLLVQQGWAFELVRALVQTSDKMMEESQGNGSESLARLWSAGPAANGMMLALLCLVPTRRFFQMMGAPWLLLFAGIFALSLLSGFRLMTASLVFVAALTLFFQRGFTSPRVIVLFIAASLGVLAVYQISMSLPNSVQRAVSWLPGIEVSSIAAGDARQTVEWRLRLWKESLRYLPDYWLLGKGFSYDRLEFIAAFQVAYIDDLRWAIVSGAYHNGWLSMLLCTGVIGLGFCLYLLIIPPLRHWKRQVASWNDPELQRYHGVFLAALVANVAIFLFIYGDVPATFQVVFFQWAVLETVSRADAIEGASTVADAPKRPAVATV